LRASIPSFASAKIPDRSRRPFGVVNCGPKLEHKEEPTIGGASRMPAKHRASTV
jgi:hypothetical protein